MTKETKNRIDAWVGEKYVWLQDQIYTNIAKGQMKQYGADLTIHMVETLYTIPEEKVIQMLDDGKVEWWLLVGASQQLRSSTSPFYRIYRQEKSWSREDGIPGSFNSIFDRPEEVYDDSLMECFKETYDNLHWYDKEIMNKYWYENKSLDDVYKYYGISKIHLIKDINRIINQIRTKCNNC